MAKLKPNERHELMTDAPHQRSLHQRTAKPKGKQSKKGEAMAVHDDLADVPIVKLNIDPPIPKRWKSFIDVRRQHQLIVENNRPISAQDARNRLHAHIKGVFREMVSSISDNDVWVIEKVLRERYGTPNNNRIAPPEIWATHTCLEVDIAADDITKGTNVSANPALVSAMRSFREFSAWNYYESGKIPKVTLPLPKRLEFAIKLGSAANPTTLVEQPVYTAKLESGQPRTPITDGVGGLEYALVMEQSGARIFTTSIDQSQPTKEFTMPTTRTETTKTTTVIEENQPMNQHATSSDNNLKDAAAGVAGAAAQAAENVIHEMRESAERLSDAAKKVADSAVKNAGTEKPSMKDRTLKVLSAVGKGTLMVGGVAAVGYGVWILARSTRVSDVVDVVQSDVNTLRDNTNTVATAAAAMVRMFAR